MGLLKYLLLYFLLPLMIPRLIQHRLLLMVVLVLVWRWCGLRVTRRDLIALAGADRLSRLNTVQLGLLVVLVSTGEPRRYSGGRRQRM